MSLAELGVIGVVALVVLKPEHLPEVLYKAGKLLKRFISFKTELQFHIQQYLQYLSREAEQKQKPPDDS